MFYVEGSLERLQHSVEHKSLSNVADGMSNMQDYLKILNFLKSSNLKSYIACACSVHNNQDYLWLKFYILSNRFPTLLISTPASKSSKSANLCDTQHDTSLYPLPL
jgi:hypothetical protein